MKHSWIVLGLVSSCAGCGSGGPERSLHAPDYYVLKHVTQAIGNYKHATGQLPSDWKELGPYMEGLPIHDMARRLPMPLQKGYVFLSRKPSLPDPDEHALPPGRVILVGSVPMELRGMEPQDRKGRYVILELEDGHLLRTWLPERVVQAVLAPE
jgi:hypothetical protein